MCRKRTSESQRGFTLIELLVVISIITLLMALLFPALQMAKKQAQAIVCQSRLREVGLLGSMYAHENDGSAVWRVLRPEWRRFNKSPELSLCPLATKPLPGERVSWGGTFHAYSLIRGFVLREEDDPHGLASFGFNYWVDEDDQYVGAEDEEAVSWRSCNIKGASSVPVAFDSTYHLVGPCHVDPPPEFEALPLQYGMTDVTCPTDGGRGASGLP